MNKQELYDKINQLPSVLGWQGHGANVMIAKDSVLELVRQLEEPQKVAVPQFVAEWIDYLKSLNSPMRDVFGAISDIRVNDWLCNAPDADEILARAWLDGYEVEQEKLYTVEIPDPHSTEWSTLYLAKDPNGKLVIHTWSNYTSTAYANNWKFEKNAHLTESEIRKDFDWAWQAGFAREVE